MPLVKEDLGRTEFTHADILLFGASGAGKTTLAATAPGPLYVVGADPSGHKVIPFRVDGKHLRCIDDMEEVLIGFYEGGHGYKALMVDGLDRISKQWAKEMGEHFFKEYGAKDPELLPIQARTKILMRFASTLRRFIDLTQVPNVKDRVHVIFTTLEEHLDNDETGTHRIRAGIGTKTMNEDFPAMFSVRGYVKPSNQLLADGTPDQTRFTAFCQYRGIDGNDRLNLFPPIGPAPNLSDYLKGE